MSWKLHNLIRSNWSLLPVRWHNGIIEFPISALSCERTVPYWMPQFSTPEVQLSDSDTNLPNGNKCLTRDVQLKSQKIYISVLIADRRPFPRFTP